MDEHFKTNFNWLNTLPEQPKASWHSYTYHVGSDKVELLRQQIAKVNDQGRNERDTGITVSRRRASLRGYAQRFPSLRLRLR